MGRITFCVSYVIVILLEGSSFVESLSLSVGESGLGKSTCINSLFLTDLYKERKVPNAQGEISLIDLLVVHVNEVRK